MELYALQNPNYEILLTTMNQATSFDFCDNSSSHMTKIMKTGATYKLIWQGFPVMLVRTSNTNRTFNRFDV